MSTDNMMDVAKDAVQLARKKGAHDVGAAAYLSRQVDVDWRDGKLEKISDATTRGLALQLYVDGRFSACTTSDLRPDALERFVEDAVTLTRTLAKDPFRALPDPSLYVGQSKEDLQIRDPGYASVTPRDRLKVAQELEQAARAPGGKAPINSVSAGFSDSQNEVHRVHSNGFEGSRFDTAFSQSVSVSVLDSDGRRPRETNWAGSRFLGLLPKTEELGRVANERAMSRLGAKKMESAVLPMLVENRAAGNLVGRLLGPMHAQALQQKRSFLEGKLNTQVGSAWLDVTDDPLIVKGLGSRLFDNEGIAAKRLPLFKAGVLMSYYVDNYYGRKLSMTPTTGGTSNLMWKLGSKSRDQLVAEIKDGVLVTTFLGGNSNSTTGDFSLGVTGFRIRGGKLAEPVAEVNLSGNHLEFWKRLVAVGNDPFPSSPLQTPTLMFEGAQFAGV